MTPEDFRFASLIDMARALRERPRDWDFLLLAAKQATNLSVSELLPGEHLAGFASALQDVTGRVVPADEAASVASLAAAFLSDPEGHRADRRLATAKCVKWVLKEPLLEFLRAAPVQTAADRDRLFQMLYRAKQSGLARDEDILAEVLTYMTSVRMPLGVRVTSALRPHEPLRDRWRRTAVEAVANVHKWTETRLDREVQAALIGALGDRDPWIREAAMVVLRQVTAQGRLTDEELRSRLAYQVRRPRVIEDVRRSEPKLLKWFPEETARAPSPWRRMLRFLTGR